MINSLGNAYAPPIVLLPGWSFQADCFQQLAQRLAQSYRLYCIDLYAIPHTHHTPERAADWLHTQLPKESALWIGWSLGGLVAAAMANRYPDHVLSWMTLATNPCFLTGTDWPGVAPIILKRFIRQYQHHPQNTMHAFRQLIQWPAHIQVTEPTEQYTDHPHHWLNCFEQDYRSFWREAPQTTAEHYFGIEDSLVPKTTSEYVSTLNDRHRIHLCNGGHCFFLQHNELILKSVQRLCRE